MSNDIKAVAAVLTLENLGFEFNGRTFWKPPVGKIPCHLIDTPKYVTFANVWDSLDTSEDDFDNLVRSEYIIQECDYFKLDKLSEEQKEFLQKELPIYNEQTFYWEWGYCYYDAVDKEFVGCDGTYGIGKELSFNLLFVEKSE